MNAVEIEQAISALAEQPFDAEGFPFAFLQAFGNRETTLKRLRKGESNKSDLGGVLQTNNIHIAVAAPGEVTKTLAALKASPATIRAKARFVLATDGETFEAEDMASGETVACAYPDFPNHFGFFLPLAGITTVKQVRENAFDIRATSRLNRLYVELLKDNPDWGTAARRPDMNHFMARLIFCFFAEDTDIFNGTGLFTATIEQMSARDSSNTNEVIGALFRAMNTKIEAHGTGSLAVRISPDRLVQRSAEHDKGSGRRLRLPPPPVQDELRITVRLRTPIEDQVARGLERNAIEPRRHRLVQRIIGILPIHHQRHPLQCLGHLRPCHHAMQQPVGDVLRRNPQGRAIFHQSNIVDIRHFRAPDPLIDPAHHISQDALAIVV